MWSAWLKILENNENYSIFNQFWTRNEQRKQESKILEIFFKVGLRYFHSRMVQICSKDFLKSTYASMYRDDRLIRLFSSTISEGLSRFDSDPHSALKFPDQQNRKFRICLKSKKPVFRNLWRFDMDPNSRIRTTCLQSGSGSFLRCQQKVSFSPKFFSLPYYLPKVYLH